DAGTADAVDERARVLHLDGLALLQRREERRRGRGLRRPDFRARTQLVDGRCDAARETAATVRRDDRVDVGQVLEDLEGDRAVAGHDVVVAERMHEETLDTCALVRAERVEPLVVRHRDDRAAETLDRGDLRPRRTLGYDDGALDPETA